MDDLDVLIAELLLQTYCWICQQPLPTKCPWCTTGSIDCSMKVLQTSYGYRVVHQHCWDKRIEAFAAKQ